MHLHAWRPILGLKSLAQLCCCPGRMQAHATGRVQPLQAADTCCDSDVVVSIAPATPATMFSSSAAPQRSYVGQPHGSQAITPEQDEQIVGLLKEHLGDEESVQQFDVEHRQILWHSHVRTPYILRATSLKVRSPGFLNAMVAAACQACMPAVLGGTAAGRTRSSAQACSPKDIPR